jgi:hypothetical protein
MKLISPIRLLALGLIAAAALVPLSAQISAQTTTHPPAPIVRRPPPPPPPHAAQPPAGQPVQPNPAPIQRPNNPGQKPMGGEHLGGWIDHHSNLTPAQQQQALEKEPGFHDLPPQTQQRYRDRLVQLGNMTPEQRARTIQRTEAMERLTPDQRGQVRAAVQPLAGLPTDRRRAVSRTFRTLRDMPPAQRQAYMNSPDFRGQFTDQERGILSNLMAAEAYIPRSGNDERPPMSQGLR